VRIVVAYSPSPREVDLTELVLEEGATARDAVQASGLPVRYPQIEPATQPLGVWGVRVDADHVLRDGDRVELYRPLRVDPKEARRRRHRQRAK
jgi:putative ubiquitin-RnfH superfamily antitoxin RatB of RatAB toxin-antitoxin module